MRTLLALVAAWSLFFAPELAAQINRVSEVEKSMSFGTRPGFALNFSNTDKRVVEDVWADFVKENFDSKLKKGKKDERTAAECSSIAVSAGNFTLYSYVEKVGDGTQITTWFDTGAFFLNRNDDAGRTEEVKALLTRFYYDVRRAAISLEVKAEEDKLRDVESRIKRLKRDNDNLHKDIANFKAKLKKAEEDLVQNQKDQETSLIDMDRQRGALDEAQKRRDNVENEQ
ncbi:MAG: hypothetical protein ACKVU2_03305 [Saprospiraceae bacterium]